MGDIFRKKVEPEKAMPSVDAILAYTEIYHRLLRDYKNEIQLIEDMMMQLRREREIFYIEKLPAMLYNRNTKGFRQIHGHGGTEK